MADQTPQAQNVERGSTNMSKYLVIIGFSALIGGCTTTSKENTIPQSGPTMEQVYRNHSGSGASKGARFESDIPRRQAEDVHPSAYTRTSLNETKNRFSRIPNPDLVMYVFPHLAGSGGRYPVPGYTTVFPMYESVEYALPGEVAPTESTLSNTQSPSRERFIEASQPKSSGPEKRRGSLENISFTEPQ